jgi:hypothetical protein
MTEISGAVRASAIAIDARQMLNKKAAPEAPLPKSKFRDDA